MGSLPGKPRPTCESLAILSPSPALSPGLGVGGRALTLAGLGGAGQEVGLLAAPHRPPALPDRQLLFAITIITQAAAVF